MIKRIPKFVAFVFCVAALLYMAGYMLEVEIIIVNRIILNSIILTALLESVLCLMDMLLFEKEKRANIRKEVAWNVTLIFTLATVIQIVAVMSMPFLGKVVSVLGASVMMVYLWGIDQMLIKPKRKE